MIMSFFFLSLLLLLPFSSSSAFYTSLYIDCGSSEDSIDLFNRTWLSDRFFTGGSTGVVSEPLRFRHVAEKTLRYFPLSFGKKNCYAVPLPYGRYFLRLFTVYDNYNGKSRSPSFDVSVEGTLVFSWRDPWPGTLARDGSYSDLFVFVGDGELDVCFYSIATDPPVIGSVEIFGADPASYDSLRTGSDVVLVNYARLSCGSLQWGPGFSNDTDFFGRSWQSDADFRYGSSTSSARSLWTREKIGGVDRPPNYFPMKLYQTALTVEEGGVLEYELTVDAKLDYLLWFHFAEIDSTVKKAGERVFDVLVNDENVSRVDIYKEVGGFNAYTMNYTLKNLSTTALTVKLVRVVGAPLINGLENYAIVPADLSTLPEQVTAMRALKDSLRVPDRMGWNGDPCAPASWDAWEGVACRLNKEGTGLVIVQIDLGSQGLKGNISENISLLSDLVGLNLSSNSLSGSLPLGLDQKSLVKLDLSNNQFTGSIPESLPLLSLKLLLLNDNLLEGRVAEQLFSIGVHGGVIDLSGNKGLCGVSSLPACPMSWEDGHLSEVGKVAIGISCVTVLSLSLSVYFCFIRRRRNNYNFLLPRDLMFAARRNKYQRQKSLMILEMESQRAKGLPTLPINSH